MPWPISRRNGGHLETDRRRSERPEPGRDFRRRPRGGPQERPVLGPPLREALNKAPTRAATSPTRSPPSPKPSAPFSLRARSVRSFPCWPMPSLKCARPPLVPRMLKDPSAVNLPRQRDAGQGPRRPRGGIRRAERVSIRLPPCRARWTCSSATTSGRPPAADSPAIRRSLRGFQTVRRLGDERAASQGQRSGHPCEAAPSAPPSLRAGMMIIAQRYLGESQPETRKRAANILAGYADDASARTQLFDAFEKDPSGIAPAVAEGARPRARSGHARPASPLL